MSLCWWKASSLLPALVLSVLLSSVVQVTSGHFLGPDPKPRKVHGKTLIEFTGF